MNNTSIIEVTGITGCGKTSLINKILQLANQNQLKIAVADDLLIKKYYLSFFKKSGLKSFLIDLIVFPYIFKRDFFKQIPFYFKNIFKSKDPIFIKINTLRNVVKRLGVYYRLHKIKQNLDLDIVLLDEGTLHIAHNTFVHEQEEPDMEALKIFFDYVPLYDKIILLNSPYSNLISVLDNRKHARITKGNKSVSNFIKNATIVFSEIKQNHRIKPILFEINRKDNNFDAGFIIKYLKNIISDD